MLGTAQADTFSTQFTSLSGIFGSISVGADLQGSELVSPSHYTAESTCDGSVYRCDLAGIDVTGGTVDGDIVSLVELLTCQCELLILLVHGNIAAAGYTAGSHAAGNHCSVRGHAAAHGQDTLSGLHAGNILGRSLQTNQNHLLASCVPSLGILSGKYHLAAGSAGRCTQTLAQRSGSLQGCGVKLGMQQRIQVAGVDHGHRLCLCLVALIYQVTGNLQSSLGSSLTVTALQHVQLLVLNGELHILHIMVVVLQNLTYLDELFICLGELLLHLRDGHGSTHACNHVLTLSILQELTHQLLLAGGRVTGESNACAGLIVQVSEHHGHNVYRSTPGIRDIIVTTVHICAGVVPRAENGLDGQLQLFYGVGGEILAQLVLVLCLELFCQSL